jgi:hypothetical protein
MDFAAKHTTIDVLPVRQMNPVDSACKSPSSRSGPGKKAAFRRLDRKK